MKEWYQISTEDVKKKMETSEHGLTTEEAAKRLAQYGENVLVEGKKKSVLKVFFGQFVDLLVGILIVAAVISACSGNPESTFVILVVIVLNALLGTVQYVKAEKSLESLKDLTSPNAKVLRSGVKVEIPAKEVVPGDLLLLEAGDMVAADGRIRRSYSLQVNESSLTGESTNVEKREGVIEQEAALGDRVNMVYSGSLVTYGRAEVFVTETAMNTEIGKIAGLLSNAKEKKTPLQIALDDFGKKLSYLILAVCALVFGLSMYRDMPLLDAMMFAVALAVAAIPEALGSIVTIVQAMGTQKMAREHAIIKDLKAVESLGCVSVICSDKTGTLTQNKMTVQKIYLDHTAIMPEALQINDQLHRYLMYDAILNNDARMDDGKVIGDPTESALLEMVRKCGVDDDFLRGAMERQQELPFDSDRKLMSTVYALHGVPTLLTKGAPDVLLKRAVYLREKQGIRRMTEEDRTEILEQNQRFSGEGLRVLAFAYRELKESEELTLSGECDYIFLGLVAMIDPPRAESAAAVADAKRAGIRPVMITGDHKVTATAIAKQIGIFGEGDIALVGPELDAMPDKELDHLIGHIAVFARVSPENKIRIVEAWQRRGSVVAMTGDGVNDAPALKAADIGVAMGITGTEVSKDAAAMILTDDNFATIVEAVGQGRTLYSNILKAIQFLLSSNLGEVLTVFVAVMLNWDSPLLPIHILWVNLITDSLPALALGMEPAEPDVMRRPPRDPKAAIFDRPLVFRLAYQGLLIALCTLAAYRVGCVASIACGQTMAFAVLSGSQIVHSFNLRSNTRSLFSRGPQNRWMFLAGAAALALQLLVLFVPFLRDIFRLAVLTPIQWAVVILLALVPLAVVEAMKALGLTGEHWQKTA